MKSISTTPAAIALALASTTIAYPGMGKMLRELQAMHARAPASFLGSTQLLGDLTQLPDSSLSASGAAIKAILSGAGQPLGDAYTVYTAPGPLGSPNCAADRCCVYKYAALAMQAAFTDPTTGQCTRLARAALRLGFHDAGAWETSMGYGSGGADGSVLLSPVEAGRHDNEALVVIGNVTLDWYNQFHAYGAGMADLIQLGAMTAVASCPGGPRMRFFVGRVDSDAPAPAGLLPLPTQSPEELIALFGRKTFTPGGLAVLVGAHTVSTQVFAIPAARGMAQDSTPGTWDNDFYNTTIAAGPPPPGVVRFDSDVALSRHEGTAESFQFFATSEGRVVWQQAFAAEYLRASLLGVYNLNEMVDCSNALPLSTFTG